jgi:hypothetical protein
MGERSRNSGAKLPELLEFERFPSCDRKTHERACPGRHG